MSCVAGMIRGAAAAERKSVGRPGRVTAQPRRSVDRENRLTVSLKPLSDRVVTHGRNWVSQQVLVGISNGEFGSEACPTCGYFVWFGWVDGIKKIVCFISYGMVPYSTGTLYFFINRLTVFRIRFCVSRSNLYVPKFQFRVHLWAQIVITS